LADLIESLDIKAEIELTNVITKLKELEKNLNKDSFFNFFYHMFNPSNFKKFQQGRKEIKNLLKNAVLMQKWHKSDFFKGTMDNVRDKEAIGFMDQSIGFNEIAKNLKEDVFASSFRRR
jgi:hypothetical protein